MTNYEKYKDLVIHTLEKNNFCDLANFVYSQDCKLRMCSECKELIVKWLDEEYKPRVDWSKVPVDTPVIVREMTGKGIKRHFCKYEPKFVEPFVCFNDGRTSFTGGATTHWDNCELARPEDIEKYSI